MVKLDIVTGFLGAGKTTLINKLLRECWQEERPVLIENEFGDVPIDTALIADPDIQVKLLASGCICCSLKGSFVQGITQVVETYRPGRILIEPTGLADLEDVLAACAQAAEQVPLEVNSVITVVSGENLLPLLDVGGPFFRRQIQEARFALVSCAQLCTPEELQEVRDTVRALNPDCPILAEDWEKLDGLTITAAAEEAAAQYARAHGQAKELPVSPHAHDHHDHHDHPHYDAEAFTALPFFPRRRFSEEALDGLLSGLESAALGQIFRAKGFLTMENGARVLAEYVYGRGSRVPSGYTGRDRFVVIGRDLDREALTALVEGVRK